MGLSVNDIVNSIIGGGNVNKDDVSKSDQSQTGTVNTTGTSNTQTQSSQTTGTVTQGKTKTSTDSASTVQSLSNDQIKSLTGVLDSLTKNFSLTNLSALQDKIGVSSDALVSGGIQSLTRALNSDSTLSASIQPILDAARLNTQRQNQALVTKAAGDAGSAFNSIVTDVGARANADGEINLAALGAQLVQSSHKQVSDEIATALAGLSNATSVLASAGTAVPIAEANINATNAGAAANIANVLKGAITQTNSSSTSDADTRQETQTTTNQNTSVIGNTSDNKNININDTTSTIGKSNTQTNNSLLGDFENILKALG